MNRQKKMQQDQNYNDGRNREIQDDNNWLKAIREVERDEDNFMKNRRIKEITDLRETYKDQSNEKHQRELFMLKHWKQKFSKQIQLF